MYITQPEPPKVTLEKRAGQWMKLLPVAVFNNDQVVGYIPLSVNRTVSFSAVMV